MTYYILEWKITRHHSNDSPITECGGRFSFMGQGSLIKQAEQTFKMLDIEEVI